jgi:dipeptidase E
MRIYLSSFDVGDAPGEFVNLAPSGRVGLVMNALDNRAEARATWQAAQTRKLADLGFSVEPLDLRRNFGRSSEMAGVLAGFDAVWINGGNTFVLRRAMALSGFDAAIREALWNDEIVYAGFSAAAVVLPKSLRGLELVDDPNDVPDGYPRDVPWDGLDLLPFSIVVHFDSAHGESEGTRKELDYYKERGIPFRTLRDGEAMVLSHGSERIVPGRSPSPN